MRYEITENNTALIYFDTQDAPVISQPFDPSSDGSAFKSKSAAEKWAKAWIAAREAELAAASAPAEETVTPTES